jgi:hypothetical protein
MSPAAQPRPNLGVYIKRERLRAIALAYSTYSTKRVPRKDK